MLNTSPQLAPTPSHNDNVVMRFSLTMLGLLRSASTHVEGGGRQKRNDYSSSVSHFSIGWSAFRLPSIRETGTAVA